MKKRTVHLRSRELLKCMWEKRKAKEEENGRYEEKGRSDVKGR